MFTFDLDGGSKGAWFPFVGSKITDQLDEKGNPVIEYFEPEKDAGRVQVSLLDAEILDEIYSKTRKPRIDFVKNPDSRKMERVDSFTQTAKQKREEFDLTWDAAIKDWKGILDKSGKEIPCTYENKLKMMKIPVFARFITKCLDDLNKEKENSEKN